MIVDVDLCCCKLCDCVLIIYVIVELYIGYMGLGGVGDLKGLLELVLC